MRRKKLADIPYQKRRKPSKVAQELVEERYGQDVQCQRTDRTLGGRYQEQAHSTVIDLDLHLLFLDTLLKFVIGSENYHKPIENMNAMVRDARKTQGDGPFQSLLAEMDRILDQFAAIRLSEFEKWAEHDLKKDFTKNKTKVIMEDKMDSRYNLQWKAANYRETIKANRTLFGTKTDRKSFGGWLSNYGSPYFEPSKPKNHTPKGQELISK